jgi:phosphate transport system substrate-binding protein
VRSKFVLVGALLPVIAFAPGCMSERKETPTKGNLTVVASESVAPLLQREQETFVDLYRQAHVELLIASDREAIVRLFNDSITTIVSSRALNAEERAAQQRDKMVLGEYKIALDGIAVIVNTANSLEGIRTTQLDSIITRRAVTWKSLGSDMNGPIEVCLPSRNSSTFEIMADKILKSDTAASPDYVAKTSPEMIDLVRRHPGAVGFVGLNWLNEHKTEVKALELADPTAPESLGTRGKYFGPFQAYVYQGHYPLSHDVWMYSRADNYGVAAGFITFICSAAGQKIVQSSGLVPATMPVRIVETTNRKLGGLGLSPWFLRELAGFGTIALVEKCNR